MFSDFFSATRTLKPELCYLDLPQKIPQNILPIHWKMCNFLEKWNLRTVRFTSLYVFLNLQHASFITCKRSRHQMETYSKLLAICAGNSTVTGELPAQRPVTRSFDVFFDLHPNKRLSKQWWGWWFETPSRPLWRHSNDDMGSIGNIPLPWDGWVMVRKC